MTTPTPKDLTSLLADLKALEAKATAGPWMWENDDVGDTALFGSARGEDCVLLWCEDDKLQGTEANKQFIAAARNALPRLVSALENVLALCDTWEAIYHRGLESEESGLNRSRCAGEVREALSSPFQESVR